MELHQNDIFANRYVLKKQLGKGGFGEVWKAYDNLTKKHIAIKIHLKGGDAEAAQEIVKEYTRVMHIHHDNLLTPSHVDVHDGVIPYLVMELCDTDLADKDLLEMEVWHLIRDVSSGLKRLAENKSPKERLDGTMTEAINPIIHQDIKPANILLRSNGMYAISDFGISKRRLSSLSSTNDDAEHEEDSAMTVDYAAPERFPRGKGVPVQASDIWSLGAMLYEIVEGHRPFAECGGDCLNPTIGLKIPAITREGYSDELKQLIYDCMAREPERRPTAAQLQDYAEKVLRSEPRKKVWSGASIESMAGYVPEEKVPQPQPEPKPEPKIEITPQSKHRKKKIDVGEIIGDVWDWIMDKLTYVIMFIFLSPVLLLFIRIKSYGFDKISYDAKMQQSIEIVSAAVPVEYTVIAVYFSYFVDRYNIRAVHPQKFLWR